MGSSFAGIKAGIIGGVIFVGSLGVLNYVVFMLLKASVIGILIEFPECSGGANPTVEECFQTLLTASVPLSMFVTFSISLIFAFIFGRFFESFPGRSPFLKALLLSYAMLAIFYYFFSGIIIMPGFVSLETDSLTRAVLLALDLAATAVYAYVLGIFYKRYTRVVEFSSAGPDPVTIFVGKRKVTGKSVTFSTRSSHKVIAVASSRKIFKEWAYSGGVTVEDQKSYETVMKVDGNGILKAYSTSPT